MENKYKETHIFCPFCQTLIDVNAQKCPACQEWINEQQKEEALRKRKVQGETNANRGLLGCGFFSIVFISSLLIIQFMELSLLEKLAVGGVAGIIEIIIITITMFFLKFKA